jgi:uncharacterized protein YjdB
MNAMNSTRYRYLRAALTGLVAFAAACSDPDSPSPPTPTDAGQPDAQQSETDAQQVEPDAASPVASVQIEPAAPVVAIGDRLTLTATPLDNAGNRVEQGAGIARWESSNPAVAPVSSAGEVLGATAGTTTITATFRDVSTSVELVVTDVSVASVDVLPARVVFTIGDTFTFIAAPFDDGGQRIDAGLDVGWRVVDESIATVDASGTVTAIAAGTTQLVGTIAGVEGNAELVVEDAVLEGITIDQAPLVLAPTRGATLTASLTWQDAAPPNLPTVAWSSSAPAVATVSSNGEVAAIAPGQATIEARAGGFSDTVVVEVVGDFNEVAAGAEHACARIRGVVFCWGSDADGQLGHDENGFASVGDIEFDQVATGRAHTCGRTATGQVWCWGANDHGQLGVGDTTSRDTPTQVSGTFTAPLRAERDVTCAGSQCWGALPGGDALRPTAQVGELSVGANHSCVLSGTTTTCSGANDQGQLGINSSAPTGSGTPAGGYSFTALSLGDAFSCGVVFGGGLACWGDGDFGQLGDGNFTDAAVPLLVPLQSVVGTLVTGSQHACVRLPTGSLRCWGRNARGQVGNGSAIDSGVPSDVGGSQTWSLVSAEAEQTCGLDDTGGIWCWGNGVLSPTQVVPTW